jgi:hypothetical protein
MVKEKVSRSAKAKQLFDDGVRPIKTADGWTVLGSKDFYEVRCEQDQWTCDCKDFQFRGLGASATDLCKHIQLVRMCQEFDRAVCDMNDAPRDVKHDIHLKPGRVVV